MHSGWSAAQVSRGRSAAQLSRHSSRHSLPSPRRSLPSPAAAEAVVLAQQQAVLAAALQAQASGLLTELRNSVACLSSAPSSPQPRAAGSATGPGEAAVGDLIEGCGEEDVESGLVLGGSEALQPIVRITEQLGEVMERLRQLGGGASPGSGSLQGSPLQEAGGFPAGEGPQEEPQR